MIDLTQAIAAAREADSARHAAYKFGDKAEIAATNARCANTQANIIKTIDAAQSQAAAPNVDWLANVIRQVDGNNSRGAGILAECIVEAMRSAALAPPAALVADASVVHAGYALAKKWRGLADDALRRSGTWDGVDMCNRINRMAGELEAMLAANKENGNE